jgi:putative salt-induced outer membrane protein YdiY
MRSFLAVSLTILVLSAGPALGQVNTEAMRSFDVDGFATTLGGDVLIESGNSDLYEVGLNTRFDYRRDRHYTFLVGQLRYGEEGGAIFKNRAFSHLRYNYQLTPWLVGEAFTQLQHDGFKLLQLRVLVGGGGRFRYTDTGTVGLFQGTTIMYEHENLDGGEVVGHPAKQSIVRWSNYLSVRIELTEQTSFVSTVYVQPRLDAFEDLRILHDASIAVAITDHLTLRTTLNLYYDSRPPDNVEDLDVELRNGLQVRF